MIALSGCCLQCGRLTSEVVIAVDLSGSRWWCEKLLGLIEKTGLAKRTKFDRCGSSLKIAVWASRAKALKHRWMETWLSRHVSFNSWASSAWNVPWSNSWCDFDKLDGDTDRAARRLETIVDAGIVSILGVKTGYSLIHLGSWLWNYPDISTSTNEVSFSEARMVGSFLEVFGKGRGIAVKWQRRRETGGAKLVEEFKEFRKIFLGRIECRGIGPRLMLLYKIGSETKNRLLLILSIGKNEWSRYGLE